PATSTPGTSPSDLTDVPGAAPHERSGAARSCAVPGSRRGGKSGRRGEPCTPKGKFMKSKWYGRALIAAVAVGAALLGGSIASATPPPSGSPITPQIIGGHDATETYSFMVALSNGCGGSLVATQWIVTADHCGSASSGRIGSIYKN